jgi:hypothetical protein
MKHVTHQKTRRLVIMEGLVEYYNYGDSKLGKQEGSKVAQERAIVKLENTT